MPVRVTRTRLFYCINIHRHFVTERGWAMTSCHVTQYTTVSNVKRRHAGKNCLLNVCNLAYRIEIRKPSMSMLRISFPLLIQLEQSGVTLHSFTSATVTRKFWTVSYRVEANSLSLLQAKGSKNFIIDSLFFYPLRKLRDVGPLFSFSRRKW